SGGLADRETGARGRPVLDKVDGLDLTTTLDAVLQAEAEYCLEHPEGDKNADYTDKTWLENPTGAIVLVSPTGDVIVAASVPLAARPPAPGRKLVSDDVRERTLTKPDFQPPGSVFKPFVAAYALDRLGLDPRLIRDCSAAANPSGHGPGYGGVHCHETRSGHGPVDLNRALTVSCNSYFAWLGEQYDSENLRSMAHEFGFGEPTGVRAFDNGVRGGLREDFVGNLFQGKELKGRSLCEAGNGLSVVEATPMQIARATAGLATGRLPQLRLVSRIGDTELQSEGRDLTISTSALDVVRSAMLAVAGTSEGSAHAALSESELGFAMAAKTGSADLTSFAVEDNRVLKHTWVAGWFPAENPVGILVVFEHRTTRTSTHGAIWLARQFLRRPAVSAWIAEQTSSR
ncbi:MAG TPA: penicillin-binding transpeptidase domain-containing protein, partial [Planctomycetota bacterium]|nr:penicillin-binding transpeptidase domain-containing protein [Planctomycetota bacterium]